MVKYHIIYPYPYGCSTLSSGFADGRSETSPDSEQIEYTAVKPLIRNSVSVEQIQDKEND